MRHQTVISLVLPLLGGLALCSYGEESFQQAIDPDDTAFDVALEYLPEPPTVPDTDAVDREQEPSQVMTTRMPIHRPADEAYDAAMAAEPQNDVEQSLIIKKPDLATPEAE